MKYFFHNLFFYTCSAMLAVGLLGMQKNDTTTNNNQSINEKIVAKTYTFEAQMAIPTGGRTIQLNTYFDFRVSGDTIFCNLPYFGKYTQTPINPGEAGYNFTSTKYQYIVNKPKEDEWKIEFIPQGRTHGEKFMLTTFNNDNATMVVTSTYRKPISFRGIIR